jgi:hypothetical protein
MSSHREDEELLVKLAPYILTALLFVLSASFIWNLFLR